MYENSGRALPKGSLDSKGATSGTQIELANRSTRSTWTGCTCGSKCYGETCSNIVDYRISGVPLSAVERQNTTRENKGKKLIEKFEKHPYKESFLQDLSQTHKINKVSKESQDLLTVMNNMEVFELCENSSKQQCLECITSCQIGIINCSCKKPTEFEQNNYDATSILGCVIKRNSSLGSKHGPSERHNVLHSETGAPEKAR